MNHSMRIRYYVGMTTVAASVIGIPTASADPQPWTSGPAIISDGTPWTTGTPRMLPPTSTGAPTAPRPAAPSHPHQHAPVRHITGRVAPQGADVGKHVTVRAGETLSGLFPHTWRHVARINGIQNPDLIFVGQIINY
jgi:hypothetical protein